MLHVDAVENTNRPGLHEVAADNSNLGMGHGGIWQAPRQTGLNLQARRAGGGQHLPLRARRGDAALVVKAGLFAGVGHHGIQLGSIPMNQYDFQAQCV